MICVRIQGGLGNQLFQYAAARKLSLHHNTELIFDISTLSKKRKTITERSLELDRFQYAGRISLNSETYIQNLMLRVPIISRWFTRWRIYNEPGAGYCSDFNNLPDHSYLVGYWQSHHYFSDIRMQLIADFEPVNPISAISKAVLNQIDTYTSVALHVRRGDYVSLASAAKFHGALPLSYYTAAVARVRECIVEPKFFVFSDDPEWCRRNLQLSDSAIFVDHNSGSDSWQDLILMGRCRHHVIANSSFSWWGAWLADQRWGVPQRLVIAPARWFSGHPEQNLSDRFPSHWEIIF
jgi:hypothetical protein